jgi:hypothetical protein
MACRIEDKVEVAGGEGLRPLRVRGGLDVLHVGEPRGLWQDFRHIVGPRQMAEVWASLRAVVSGGGSAATGLERSPSSPAVPATVSLLRTHRRVQPSACGARMGISSRSPRLCIQVRGRECRGVGGGDVKESAGCDRRSSIEATSSSAGRPEATMFRTRRGRLRPRLSGLGWLPMHRADHARWSIRHHQRRRLLGLQPPPILQVRGGPILMPNRPLPIVQLGSAIQHSRDGRRPHRMARRASSRCLMWSWNDQSTASRCNCRQTGCRGQSMRIGYRKGAGPSPLRSPMPDRHRRITQPPERSACWRI